jgi:hypothetical protein
LPIPMPSVTISGSSMPNDTWPDWEQVLASAAHLQRILPGAVLVGGSAAAVLGSLDGIETGVRQLIRDEPLETTQIEYRVKRSPSRQNPRSCESREY